MLGTQELSEHSNDLEIKKKILSKKLFRRIMLTIWGVDIDAGDLK